MPTTCLLLTIFFVLPVALEAQTRTFTKIVVKGDSTPIGGTFGGALSVFSPPALNDRGDVAFVARVDGGSSLLGIFLFSNDTIRKVVADGEARPGGGNFYLGGLSCYPPHLNSLGDVVFIEGNYDSAGIFLYSGGNLIKVAKPGEQAPGGGFPGATFLNFSEPSINDAGQVVFGAQIDLPPPGPGPTDGAIFLYSGGSTSRVVSHMDPAPGGGTFSYPGSYPQINNAGQVLFGAAVDFSSPTPDRSGIFLGSSQKIILDNETLPGGGTFYSFDPCGGFSLNHLGQGLFLALTFENNPGLYRFCGGLSKIAAVGDPTPLGGTFQAVSALLGHSLNEQNKVLVQGTISGGAATSGLFVYSANDTPQVAAATGDATPIGGTLNLLSGGMVNNLGHCAFLSSVVGGSTNSAIFFCGGPGLRLVPIQSVFHPSPGDTFRLVAQKDLVVRAFFDTGPEGPSKLARARLCIDGEINSCPPNRLFQETLTVHRYGYPFTLADRKQGKNSFNFVIRGDTANQLLTKGNHTFKAKVEPVNPGDFPAVEQSFVANFRTSPLLAVHLVPVVVYGIEPDKPLLKKASNLIRAVYPVDEDSVLNRVRGPYPFASLPEPQEFLRQLQIYLSYRRSYTIAYERVYSGNAAPDRIFFIGAVSDLINEGDALGGPAGVSFPGQGIAVVLDRVPPANFIDVGEPIIGGTLAHEMGHQHGLGDEYAGGVFRAVNPPHPPGYDPYGNGLNGWYILEPELAFDVGGIRDTLGGRKPLPVFGPGPNDGSTERDIAGYMGAGLATQYRWTTRAEYRHLYDTLTVPATFSASSFASTVSRDIAAISGLITKTDSTIFNPIIISNSDRSLPPFPSGTQYRIEFRDSAGNALYGFNFDLDFTQEVFTADSAFYDSTDAASFNIIADLPAGTHSIAMLKSGNPIKTIPRTAGSPTVEITSVKPKDGGLEVKWQGNDPDGDSLTFAILYSPDTSNRFVIEVDVRDTLFQITFDPTVIPPQTANLSTQSSVTIYATDGFNYALATAPVSSLLGDLNLDGNLTAADVVLELNCVFLGTGYCSNEVADVNCDGVLTAADVVLELNKVFLDNPFPCN